MAGVRGRNVDTVVRGDWVPVREHIAGDQELAELQSAANREAWRGQGSWGQCWVLGWELV